MKACASLEERKANLRELGYIEADFPNTKEAKINSRLPDRRREITKLYEEELETWNIDQTRDLMPRQISSKVSEAMSHIRKLRSIKPGSNESLYTSCESTVSRNDLTYRSRHPRSPVPLERLTLSQTMTTSTPSSLSQRLSSAVSTQRTSARRLAKMLSRTQPSTHTGAPRTPSSASGATPTHTTRDRRGLREIGARRTIVRASGCRHM